MHVSCEMYVHNLSLTETSKTDLVCATSTVKYMQLIAELIYLLLFWLHWMAFEINTVVKYYMYSVKQCTRIFN